MNQELCFKSINWYRTKYLDNDYVVQEIIDHDFDTYTYLAFTDEGSRKLIINQKLALEVLNTIK